MTFLCSIGTLMEGWGIEKLMEAMYAKKEVSHILSGKTSYRRCSVRKGNLRNFAKFTGKHLRQILFIK